MRKEADTDLDWRRRQAARQTDDGVNNGDDDDGDDDADDVAHFFLELHLPSSSNGSKLQWLFWNFIFVHTRVFPVHLQLPALMPKKSE